MLYFKILKFRFDRVKPECDPTPIILASLFRTQTPPPPLNYQNHFLSGYHHRSPTTILGRGEWRVGEATKCAAAPIFKRYVVFLSPFWRGGGECREMGRFHPGPQMYGKTQAAAEEEKKTTKSFFFVKE